MQVISIEEKDKLNKFISSKKHSQFLQAWQWGEFHKIVSNNAFRLGVHVEGEIIAAATIIKKVLPMGKYYFYCPRGPIFTVEEESKIQAFELLFKIIRELAIQEEVMFFRFDPIDELPETELSIQQTLDVQPSKTSILNLKKGEDELLKAMHQKTRYNIKLAEKKGVKVEESGLESFDDFWKLMCETSDRDQFRTHGINYYKEMLKLDKNYIKLFTAKYRNKIIGTSIVSFFGDTVTYMHGASSDDEKNVMAPYLLQWQVIKSAQDKGFKYYDFYGIDEKKWPGVTRFKKGFSGKTYNYPGTFDFIFDQSWYSVYKMVRKVRRTF